MSEARHRLDWACQAWGLSLSDAQHQQFMAYLDLLRRWNRVYNLTRIDEPVAMVDRHLVDSLACVPWVGVKEPLLDLGSGAGFPGVPLAILQPQRPIDLVDACRKKTQFLRQVVADLGLGCVQVHHQRLAQEPCSFKVGVVTTRAFASLADTWVLAEPCLTPGGCLVALKGHNPEAELQGLDLNAEVASVLLPGQQVTRHVVVVRR